MPKVKYNATDEELEAREEIVEIEKKKTTLTQEQINNLKATYLMQEEQLKRKKIPQVLEAHKNLKKILEENGIEI